MIAPFNNIVQHLFHQPSLQSVSLSELERMAELHPSFAAAQFLLLKKMQDLDHPGFTEQLQKTTLHFNNPLWLQLLLRKEKNAVVTAPQMQSEPASQETPVSVIDTVITPVEAVKEAPITPVVENTTATATNNDLLEKHNEHIIVEEETDLIEEILPVATALPTAEKNNHEEIITIAEEYNNKVIGAEENLLQQEIKEEHAENSVTAIAEEYNNKANTVAEITDQIEATEQAIEEVQVESEAALIENKKDELTADSNTAPEENVIAAVFTEKDHAAAEIAEDTLAAQEEILVPTEKDIEAAEIAEITLAAQIEEIIITEAPIKEQKEILVPIVDKQYSNTNEVKENIVIETKPFFKNIIEIAPAKGDMLFEPYHTIDYFASQGIKLSKLDPAPDDKFGKQLKSFTDWLKSMKKLPQASVHRALAANEESHVVAAASNSVESREVITETMAEVFEKQGLRDKASEVYRKLSLLNPAKSAYFASRIEELKK